MLRPAEPRVRVADFLLSGGRDTWGGLEHARHVQLTYNGRGAIYQYLVELQASATQGRRDVVLLPAYHCPTVVDPALHAGYRVRFYAVKEDLQVDLEDFLRKLDDKVAAALVIRYFGLHSDLATLRQACRHAGVKVMDDCSHSFLLANPLRLAASDADVTTFSFWKLIPGLTGGGMLRTAENRSSGLPQPAAVPRLESVRHGWKLFKQAASTPRDKLQDALRRVMGTQSVESVPEPAVRQPAAIAYPYDPISATWKIPVASRWLLEHADLQDVVLARRRNYAILSTMLNEHRGLVRLRPTLDEAACPWGFPVLLERRPERDYLIRAHDVPLFTFGEVLHPQLELQHSSERRMLDAARFLANSVLLFAVHQQLAAEDVAMIATTINECL